MRKGLYSILLILSTICFATYEPARFDRDNLKIAPFGGCVKCVHLKTLCYNVTPS